VELPDGHIEEFSANRIAECIYSQIDDEGRQYILLQDIIDHQTTNDKLPKEERYQVSINGNIHHRRTTKGWQSCTLWKDGSTSWESLRNMKEALPVQVVEYSVPRGIQDQMAF
jgi:hypothetical protein